MLSAVSSAMPTLDQDTSACYKPAKELAVCRSIKTLFNFAPPATDEEVRAASLQFVRKLSGFAHPSQPNQKAFDRATEDVYRAARALVDSMTTTSPPRDRATEAAKAKARNIKRFGEGRR
jgi:hypothetical protein